LGVRLPGSTYTIYDYVTYETERDRILRSSRGRAALMMGGIVWRLAMDSIGYEDVVQGPSGQHSDADVVMIDNQAFVDDTLTEHELDVICGVYRYAHNAKFGSSDMSWWPKHNTWIGSGLSIGYWTDRDEQWCQNRLQSIVRNGEGPKDARKW
ncbi:hypothetical protein BDW22DRAFT_1300863, partial [Trametopsis cervina]